MGKDTINWKEVAKELYKHLKTNLPSDFVETSKGRIEGFYDELMIGEDVNKAVEAIKKYKDLFE